MDDQAGNRVYEKDALEFATVAGEFCNLLETVAEFPRKRFLVTMQQLLSLLYLKAVQVGEVETMIDGDIEKVLTEDEWIAVKNKVSLKLGGFDNYIEIKQPDTTVDGEEVSVSLSECLADIYQDLSDFVHLFQIGSVEIMNDVLWECKQNFENYWGPRLLAVMDSFHQIIYGIEDIDSEEWDKPGKQNIIDDNPFVW